jgi:Lar family restriction alleviation protein
MKPCPFCGGVGDMVKTIRAGYDLWLSDPDAYAYHVRCRSCAAEGPWAKVKAGAIRLWNTREAQA